MIDTSSIEISESAVHGNIGFLRDHFGGSILLSSVVKANAYGHGMKNYVPLAEKAGVSHFSVFSACEARQLMKIKSSRSRIMVMGWMNDRDLKWAVENGVEFFVFEPGRLNRVRSIAGRCGKPALVHVEIETGMNRTGLSQKELNSAIGLMSSNPSCFILKGLCSHLAGAESIANHVRIQRQLSRFERLCRLFTEAGLVPEYKHVSSSAAAITYPAARFNMVRIGILQYGYWPSAETFMYYISKKKSKEDPLKRVISWKSRVMALKKVRRGEFVSYGTVYLAQEDKKLAIVPVGYSYGYSRSLSNHGRVLIRGRRVAVIGMVNMNMLIADVSNVPSVRVDDEVVLIGRQDELVISVASFSEFSNQLNYELLTRLPAGIPRRIIN
jgi:alanine racemase